MMTSKLDPIEVCLQLAADPEFAAGERAGLCRVLLHQYLDPTRILGVYFITAVGLVSVVVVFDRWLSGAYTRR